VRRVAVYDPERVERVMYWPLRDLFLAYSHILQESARENYATEVQVWATIAVHKKRPGKPPALPKILR
jgi:hypothetical protein